MPILAPRHAIAAVYAGLFFGIGVYMPFFPVWLAGRGFDPALIAFALALPMSVRLFTTPLGGILADRSGRPRATLVLYALMTALCFAGIALAPSALLILVGLGLAASFWQPSLPVLDAYAVARRAEGVLDYGRVRLWGSLSFIGGNLLAGLLLGGTFFAALPHDTVIWLIVAGSVGAAAAALLLDEAKPAPRAERQTPRPGPCRPSLCRMPAGPAGRHRRGGADPGLACRALRLRLHPLARRGIVGHGDRPALGARRHRRGGAVPFRHAGDAAARGGKAAAARRPRRPAALRGDGVRPAAAAAPRCCSRCMRRPSAAPISARWSSSPAMRRRAKARACRRWPPGRPPSP